METERLRLKRPCKHSVRYDSVSKEPKTLTALYLLNDAYVALGKPDEIVASITVAPSAHHE